MNFVENIFERLQRASTLPVVAEIQNGVLKPLTGGDLLSMVQQGRQFLQARGLKKGDRCAVIAPNSARWIALDLALMAEGVIVVPLYYRQAVCELIQMLQDSTPSRIVCMNAAVAAEVKKLWSQAPQISLIDTVFADQPSPAGSSGPIHHEDSDIVTIIYTSGTSGEPKGVVLNAGNVTFMLGCTNARLDQLMGPRGEPDRVFHYLPLSFAASWIAVLSFLSRNSVLTLSADLNKLADELKLASPDYFLNVPTLLERVRRKIEETIQQRGGFASKAFTKAQDAYVRRRETKRGSADFFWLAIANRFMFPTIRTSIGANLKGLICGSAPLSIDTQLFFMMLGIPVLQVYGLTETTAICTMDDPARVEPGRVGPAVAGTEMQVAAEAGEILVRGPHIFPGYWKRPEETANALEGGWFHTGDQGEADANGNWKITGRLKNLVVLNSGHKVPPEPLESALAQALPDAQHVVLVGNQRGFLSALIALSAETGASGSIIQPVIDRLNAGAPHYKQVRAFRIVSENFTPENGLLTANGKLKRDAIAQRFAAEIDAMYQEKTQ